MKKETIKISGMSCNHCVKSVESEVAKLKLKEYRVSIGKLDVVYDEAVVSREQLIAAIREAGYSIGE